MGSGELKARSLIVWRKSVTKPKLRCYIDRLELNGAFNATNEKMLAHHAPKKGVVCSCVVGCQSSSVDYKLWIILCFKDKMCEALILLNT